MPGSHAIGSRGHDTISPCQGNKNLQDLHRASLSASDYYRYEFIVHLEIVSHCWNYASLLNYQLSSLVLYAPSDVKITMTVFYSDCDLMTERVLKYFGEFSPLNVNWNWRNLEVPHLMRRAIGRNMAAMETSADWIWFADADMCFRETCLDSLAKSLTDAYGGENAKRGDGEWRAARLHSAQMIIC